MPKGRLQPGRMLLIDTKEGRIVGDEELKNRLSNEHPYNDWLEQNLVHIDKFDTNNPDEAKRGQPIIGLNLVNGFVYKGKGKWADGTIYDPDNGKTYSCKMTLKDANTLKVRGFIGVSLIGRTQVWTRK